MFNFWYLETWSLWAVFKLYQLSWPPGLLGEAWPFLPPVLVSVCCVAGRRERCSLSFFLCSTSYCQFHSCVSAFSVSAVPAKDAQLPSHKHLLSACKLWPKRFLYFSLFFFFSPQFCFHVYVVLGLPAFPGRFEKFPSSVELSMGLVCWTGNDVSIREWVLKGPIDKCKGA